MRLLLVLAVIGCEIPEGETTPIRKADVPPPAPAPKVVLDNGGWCPRTPWTSVATPATYLEVTQDLRSIKPLRKGGFDSYQIAYNRDARPTGGYVGRSAAIAGGKLQLSTYPTSCRETGAGCFSGYWSRPAEVVLIDPTPVSSCIAYTFGIGGSIVVGFKDEVRTYPWHDGSKITVGPRVATKQLELIDVFEHIPLLQEADGTLWVARWSNNAPSFAQVGKLPGRVRSASRGNNGLVFAYIDSGLHALDATTFAERWRVDGEVWSVMSLDVPLTHYVLTVERGAAPKVVLRMLDKTGAETKRVVVHQGAVKEAHLERSYEKVRPDLYEGVLLVRLAK